MWRKQQPGSLLPLGWLEQRIFVRVFFWASAEHKKKTMNRDHLFHAPSMQFPFMLHELCLWNQCYVWSRLALVFCFLSHNLVWVFPGERQRKGQPALLPKVESWAERQALHSVLARSVFFLPPFSGQTISNLLSLRPWMARGLACRERLLLWLMGLLWQFTPSNRRRASVSEGWAWKPEAFSRSSSCKKKQYLQLLPGLQKCTLCFLFVLFVLFFFFFFFQDILLCKPGDRSWIHFDFRCSRAALVIWDFIKQPRFLSRHYSHCGCQMLRTCVSVRVSMRNTKPAPSCSSSFSFSFFSDAGNEPWALTRFLHGCWDFFFLFKSLSLTLFLDLIHDIISVVEYWDNSFRNKFSPDFFFLIPYWKNPSSDCSCHASVIHLLSAGSSFIVAEFFCLLSVEIIFNHAVCQHGDTDILIKCQLLAWGSFSSHFVLLLVESFARTYCDLLRLWAACLAYQRSDWPLLTGG